MYKTSFFDGKKKKKNKTQKYTKGCTKIMDKSPNFTKLKRYSTKDNNSLSKGILKTKWTIENESAESRSHLYTTTVFYVHYTRPSRGV